MAGGGGGGEYAYGVINTRGDCSSIYENQSVSDLSNQLIDEGAEGLPVQFHCREATFSHPHEKRKRLSGLYFYLQGIQDIHHNAGMAKPTDKVTIGNHDVHCGTVKLTVWNHLVYSVP